MPSATLEPRFSTDSSEQRTRLLACLAEGLHTMAQPLTILRSSVPASAATGASAASHQRYAEISIQQIERACDLFECLQDLVIANQIDAECAPIDLSSLLAQAAHEQGPVMQTLGIQLRVTVPSGPLTAIGDAARTLQAIAAGLKIAASVSCSGDVVELLAAVRDGRVELTVQSGQLHGRLLNSSERLSLSLAQTNILSQSGEYECTEDPFCLRLTLPLLRSDP